MSSTEIVNRTSRALDMRIGNCRYFIKLATVERNQSYTVHVNYNDTYVEFSLGPVDSTGKVVIVTSDECVDNRTIIVREDVDGIFHVEMQPRVQPTRTVTSSTASSTELVINCEPLKKRPCTFWRLFIF